MRCKHNIPFFTDSQFTRRAFAYKLYRHLRPICIWNSCSPKLVESCKFFSRNRIFPRKIDVSWQDHKKFMAIFWLLIDSKFWCGQKQEGFNQTSPNTGRRRRTRSRANSSRNHQHQGYYHLCAVLISDKETAFNWEFPFFFFFRLDQVLCN